MKVLLTGKTGQLGFELQRSLASLAEVVAVSSAECDLRNEQAIRHLVRAVQPDIIVNPAAYTAVDRAESESELAFAVNAHAPAVFAQEASQCGALLIHYSTDYVFDGTKLGAYIESDTPNPQSVYGASKLAGEQAIQASEAAHIILRTAWVAGAHGNNFAKTMLRLASERESLSVVADQCGTPTTAALIADVTAHIIYRTYTGRNQHTCRQLYHLVASGQTNWHDYACYVLDRARRAGRSLRVLPEHVRAITSDDYPTPAKRPLNSCLDATKLSNTFNLRLPTWQSGIDHLLNQLFIQL